MPTITSTPALNANTNRFTSSSFTYDKNGNITGDIDPVTSQGRSFVSNGDNKQVEVKNASNATIGKYYYDGEGKRVKKVTDTETTIFVYSSGKLVAEYSTQVSQNPTISYMSGDHLGSPRIITDKFGSVKSRRDFMPFGEDVFAGIGGRTGDTGQKYSSGADDIRQKYTGYQKDSETSLDFAEARMYENRYGRFTAVDPLIASGKSTNPQAFNRYIYVGNNPLNRIDPNGLDWWFGNGEYRWSYDNVKFDVTVAKMLYDFVTDTPPELIDSSWTRVQLDEKGEHRYWVDGKPGQMLEVILVNNPHWNWGEGKIIDQAAYDVYLQKEDEKLRLAADMMSSVNEARAQDNALRDLTTTRTGSNPRLPMGATPSAPRLGFIFDRMRPAADGKPQVGPSAFTLGAREDKDITFAPGNMVTPRIALPGNGMSVAPNPFGLPAFKQDPTKGCLGKRIRGVPRALMPVVHENYFEPSHTAFEPRNLWSLSNAFTSAFKILSPVRQFEVTARLGAFLSGMSQSYPQNNEPQFFGHENVVFTGPTRQLMAGSTGRVDQDVIADIKKIDDSAADLESEGVEGGGDEIVDYEDMAEVISHIDDYFDPGPDDDVMEEFEQKVAA